jgi:glycosyltransferase involved in cell wall biosynthesis
MEKKKDVLFLCQYFYPEYISSATLPFDTAMALVESGLSVGTLCGYPREYSLSHDVPLQEEYKNIKIKRLRYIQLKRSSTFGRLLNFLSFTLVAALNFGELRKYKVAIVYSDPPVLPLLAALAQKLFNTKVVFVSYDIYPEIAYATKSISKNGMLGRTMKWVNKVVFKNLTKVVALSNEMKECILSLRPEISSEQVEVIPNWFEKDSSANHKDPEDNPLFKSIKRDHKFIVSYFGNMGTCQDIETIIEAILLLKQDNDVHFLFAGHGNKVGKLRNIINREGLRNVTLFGFLHDKDYADALNISDCFLVTLAEGITGLGVPSKTYSYMSAGKPIIAIIGEESDIANDLKYNNAGFVFQVGESNKLASALKKLRNNKCLQKTMGDNSRSLFLDKYTKERCTDQYVDLVSGILEDEKYVQG